MLYLSTVFIKKLINKFNISINQNLLFREEIIFIQKSKNLFNLTNLIENSSNIFFPIIVLTKRGCRLVYSNQE